MKLQRVLPYAKFLMTQAITTGDTVIDATAGNGHDTLWLSELVGDNGKVFAFDVQQDALQTTAERLHEHNMSARATLIHAGHEQVKKYVNAPVAAAIFNLGYLPGGDHNVITKPTTTLQAIDDILDLLQVDGIIVLVVYHGHSGGADERDAVIAHVTQYDQKQVHVLRYEFLNQKNAPPFIIALQKVKAFS